MVESFLFTLGFSSLDANFGSLKITHYFIVYTFIFRKLGIVVRK